MTRRAARQTIPAEAVAALRDCDPILREIIDRVGVFEASFEPDLWWSLVDAIVAQQLSIRAASTIVARVEALGPPGRRPTPDLILETPDTALRACGLSAAKTRAVKDLASKWLDGTIEPDRIPHLPDDEVIDHLTIVRGIGRWTAEMTLMFTLGRPDVLPVDDLGLRSAVHRAYGLAERPSRADVTEIGKIWRPYRSAATLYLWRSLEI